jgi:molybdopterin molybdotransferase
LHNCFLLLSTHLNGHQHLIPNRLMRLFEESNNMIEVSDAFEKVLEHAPQLPTETVSLSEALHCILAEPVVARNDSPSFNSSAMDGYGVKASDVKSASEENPVELDIVCVIKAGQVHEEPLEHGTAVKIFTGAMVPEGVEAVLMREKSSESDGKVLVKFSVKPGENIRRQGEELKTGDRALPAGILITPPVMGLLAGLGYAEVCVYRKPRVAVITTGDELLDPSAPLEKGKIRDANTYTIRAALQELGIHVITLERVPDNPEELLEAVSRLLSSADVLLVSGGVSVGDFDFVKEVFGHAGVEKVFWKVAIKPGKPTFFGTKDRKLIFGLPGNPVSALAIFYIFVRPALLQMMGKKDVQPTYLPAQMESEAKKKEGRMEFLRGKLQSQNGKIHVELSGGQYSHMLSSFAGADCFVGFPKEKTSITKGEEVHIQLLPWAAL